MSTATLIQPSEETGIAVYTPFRQQLAEFKVHNAKLVFDYTDKKQNEEARSHVFKMRKAKAAVDKAREAEKAESLAYGRKIDAEAKVIIAEIQAMIDVHQKPLDELEQKEKDRVALAMKTIEEMAVTAESVINQPSDKLKDRLAKFKDMVITIDNFQEFVGIALAAQSTSIEYLTGVIAIAEKQESDARELAKLREEAEARRIADEQRAREERLEREAKEKLDRETIEKAEFQAMADEKARIDAAIEAQRKFDAIDREKTRIANETAERERLLKEAAEKSEREKQALLDKAAQERIDADKRQADAIQAERDRQKRESDAKAAEDARREADKKHRGAIHSEIVAALVVTGISDEQAKSIVIAICGDQIPNIKIIY